MKTLNFSALASACVGCAIALGIYISSRKEQSHISTTVKEDARALGGEKIKVRTRSSRSGSVAELNVSQQTASKSDRNNDRRENQLRKDSQLSTPVIANRVVSEEEWQTAAKQVEMEANHELERLVELLDLTPDQEAPVFATLAQQSPYWRPEMQTESPPPRQAAVTTVAANQSKSSNLSPPRNERQPSLTGRPAPTDSGFYTPAPEYVENSPAPLPNDVLNVQQSDPQDEIDRLIWWEPVVANIVGAENAKTQIADGKTYVDLDSENETYTSVASPSAPTPRGHDESAVTGPQIYEVLTPDQQETLVKDGIERQAWWRDVLPKIAPAPNNKSYDGNEYLEE